MRFIDQFVNLIDQLPEPVTEKQAVEYILKGIRTEIGRLARTAKIATIDELSKFVKSNYGLKDKMHDRSAKNQFRIPTGKKVEQIDEFSDDMFSDCSNDYEIEIQEVKRSTDKSKKTVENSAKKKPAKNHNTFDKHPNVAMHCDKNEQICLCCRNARINNNANYSQHNQNQHACRNVSCNDRSSDPQIDLLNQQRTLPCPFCTGNHSYRDCPLPQAQKHKHCFSCKAPNQIAS